MPADPRAIHQRPTEVRMVTTEPGLTGFALDRTGGVALVANGAGLAAILSPTELRELAGRLVALAELLERQAPPTGEVGHA